MMQNESQQIIFVWNKFKTRTSCNLVITQNIERIN